MFEMADDGRRGTRVVRGVFVFEKACGEIFAQFVEQFGGAVHRWFMMMERAFYYNNEQLTLTALPNSGYYFVGWYENNALLSVTNQYSFNVTASRVIYAFFEEQ